jgi:hypothetical protein
MPIERGEGRERDLEAVDRIPGIQRSPEVTAREKERAFYGMARRQEHCSSLMDPLAT